MAKRMGVSDANSGCLGGGGGVWFFFCGFFNGLGEFVF